MDSSAVCTMRKEGFAPEGRRERTGRATHGLQLTYAGYLRLTE